MNMKTILKHFDRIEASSIADKGVATRVAKLQAKRKQGGFTLLELLVVVAILAAIAGTATIALQDTDARASAAAHVAMMDELNKGVRTFRVLQKNALPNNLDSLMRVDDAAAATPAATLLDNTADDSILAIGDVVAGAVITDMADVMADIGMTELRYIDTAEGDLPDDVAAGGCATDAALQATIASRGNAVVAGNIFNGSAGNGCGASVAVANVDNVAYWSGAVERIIGPGEYLDASFDGSAVSSSTVPADGTVAPVFLAAGFGPASNLFNSQELGGMTSVPVYRHVSADQYNRFIGLFHVANAEVVTGAWAAPTAADQVAFVGVVDGAGDTKEEELGEWDGTRNTI